MKGENRVPNDPQDATGDKERENPVVSRSLIVGTRNMVPSLGADTTVSSANQSGRTLEGFSNIREFILGRIQSGVSGSGEQVRDGVNDPGTGTGGVQSGPDVRGGVLLPSHELRHRTSPPSTADAPVADGSDGVIFFGQPGSGKSYLPIEIAKILEPSVPPAYIRSRVYPMEGPLGARLEPPILRIEDIIAELREGYGFIEANKVAEMMQIEREEENAHIKERIAALRGLDPKDVDEDELEELYRYRLLSSRDPFAIQPENLVDKYIGPRVTYQEITEQEEKYWREHPNATNEEVGQHGEKYRYKANRARGERFQEVSQFTEALLDLPPKLYSYGLHTPSYTTALMIADEPHPSTRQNYRALLVGALTQSTIKEFAATVDIVHSGATKLVTDIEGEATAQIDPSVATFVYSDAARLAVADESVDSIHTHILMRNITTQDPESDPHLHFIKDVKRALAPKGQLIMVEPDGDVDTIITLLKEAGFEDIAVLPALKFSTRRSVERTLTFQRYDPPELITEKSLNEMVIIATKQPAGTTKNAISSGSRNF